MATGSTVLACCASTVSFVLPGLRGDQGLNIFVKATDGSSYPKFAAISCDSTDPIDDIEQTVTANASGLTYDATTDRYTYVWKTSKEWRGCR